MLPVLECLLTLHEDALFGIRFAWSSNSLMQSFLGDRLESNRPLIYIILESRTFLNKSAKFII